MTKVRLLTGLAGPTRSWEPGAEIEVESAEAARLIERGFAVPVRTIEHEKAIRRRAAEKARK